MGSWSVSCGVSNIAIVESQECVIIPLKENKYQSYTYFTHTPLTLPIFAKYNDYGGVNEIKKDDNTKIIEKYFGITIEEFVEYILNGPATYEREEVERILEKTSKPKLLKTIKPMWVDRKVYDYLSTETFNKDSDIPIGSDFILKYLGFKLSKKKSHIERFTQKWVKGDIEVYSDGRYLMDKTLGYIYGINRTYGVSMISLIGESEETKILSENNYPLLSHLMSKDEKRKYLFSVLSNQHDYTPSNNLDYLEIINKRLKKDLEDDERKDLLRLKSIFEKNDGKSSGGLLDEYYEKIESVSSVMGAFLNFTHNLRPMSGDLKPHTLYLTPQCGAFEEHQKILDKFSEINKSYIEEFINE